MDAKTCTGIFEISVQFHKKKVVLSLKKMMKLYYEVTIAFLK